MVKLAQIERTVSMADTRVVEKLQSEYSGWSSPRHGTAESRGYGPAWKALRRQVLERDRYRCMCAECRATGRLLPAYEVDHVIPKSRGGTDDLSNLQAIHVECHRRKTYRERLAGMRQAQDSKQQTKPPSNRY